MKTKITVLAIFATVSLWAVAQNNDMNNGTVPDGSTDGPRHHQGAMNTNSDSEYGGGATNRWHGNTNDWNNSNDNMSKTNRHQWQHKDEGQNQNPPQN